MILRQARTRQLRLALWMVPVVLLLVATLFFFNHVVQVLWFFASVALVTIGFDLNVDLTPEMIHSLELTGFNCLFGFTLIFIIWSFRIAAQALLPVSNAHEVWRTAWHLFLYMLRLHGPAIFVRDGQQIASREELLRLGPGVVVIDFNSAVVLEEQIPPPDILRPIKNLIMRVLILLDLSDERQSPRACGPGIVYTRRRERIRATLDLRRQFRLLPRNSSYTRDGIELVANVWSIFTIGQDPDVLQVVYQGPRLADQLRTVNVERVPGTSRIRLTGFADELDTADRTEIHHFARVADRMGMLQAYSTIQPPPQIPVFNPDRVFSAAFSTALDENDRPIPWYDLPTRVAVEIYREIILQSNYDEFYGLGMNAAPFPLPRHRRQLSVQMRNNGLLSYRLIFHRLGIPLEIDREYEETDLIVSTIQPLRNPKVLRDRGIRVIASGFGDLNPVMSEVNRQRIESWRATWQRDTDLVHASSDLEAMQIRSHERALAQENLYLALSDILKSGEHSQEALALRVFQALESAADNPEIHALLPQNTIEILRNVHQWLLPGESSSSRKF